MVREDLFVGLVEDGKLAFNANGEITRSEGMIRWNMNYEGYWEISDYAYGKTHHCLIHRLIWRLYAGEIPDGFAVRHLDGDKQNNRIENLELVSDDAPPRDAHEGFIMFCRNIDRRAEEQFKSVFSPSSY